ncbi:MAG: hypothetical protein RLY87_161 [Chloroflexota bacterium]
MEKQERRAALSAFFWTITVMAIAGGVLFWQADIIPSVPQPQNTDAALSQYAAALDTANARLTEAGTRISSLERALTQQTTAAQPSAPRSDTQASIAVSSEQALESARSVAGALAPTADPELVDLEGQTVWSIAYEPGIVYVSAVDGSVVLVQRTQPASSGREHTHDDHHESGHDD